MKRLLGTITLMYLLLILAACNNETAESKEDKIVLKLPHIVALDNPAHIASEAFKKEVEEKSNGKIEIQIFPNGELYGSDRELIEAIQLNNVEISMVGTPSLGNFDPKFYVLDLPFLFQDRQTPRKALSGKLGEELNKGLEEINLKSLGYGYDGFRHILNSKQPIETLDDLNGLKVRVQESEIQEAIFKSLKTNPSPLAYGELYSALQQNVYQGMDGPFAMIDSGKFYEVQKYMTLTHHQYSGLIILMNNEKFNSLPGDLQDILMEASKNFEENYYNLVDKAEDTIKDRMVKEGLLEINELDDASLEEFKKAVEPVYEKYEEILGTEIIELAKEGK